MGLTRANVLLISALYASVFAIVARRRFTNWSRDKYQCQSSSRYVKRAGRQRSGKSVTSKVESTMHLGRFELLGRWGMDLPNLIRRSVSERPAE